MLAIDCYSSFFISRQLAIRRSGCICSACDFDDRARAPRDDNPDGWRRNARLGESPGPVRIAPRQLFAVSDVVLLRPISSRLQGLMALWTGCIAGALLDADYVDKLRAAGFRDIEVVPTLVHGRDTVERWLESAQLPDDIDAATTLVEMDGAVANAFIRAKS